MNAGGQNRIVLVTCGTLTEARRIARKVVEKRLAACVNVVLSPAESYYAWKGKLEKAREYLLVIKTAAKRLVELEKEVKRLHSYDVPEFIALPIVAGSRDYLSWLQESVARARKINHAIRSAGRLSGRRAWRAAREDSPHPEPRLQAMPRIQ